MEGVRCECARRAGARRAARLRVSFLWFSFSLGASRKINVLKNGSLTERVENGLKGKRVEQWGWEVGWEKLQDELTWENRSRQPSLHLVIPPGFFRVAAVIGL